ncbi:kinase-like domain-containing protein [Cytidiella melzeri]|nr:kinase-like domain-containing protein [Cytidiella melzeri]
MKEQMMLRLLTQMNVQFVARLRWSFQDQEALHIVMDYCPDADLTNYVKHTGPLLTSDVCIYAAELAEALCSLHGSGITHRSLRPEHILLHTSGHILLTGFSKSSFSSPNTPSNGYFPQSSSRSRQTTGWPCAMDEWNAPETILGWPEDCAIDIWAFGLVLWFMLTGKHPLDTGLSNESNLELHPEILLSLILHAPFRFEGHNVQADIRNLVARCIQRNARLRANAEDIKAHAYFADM